MLIIKKNIVKTSENFRWSPLLQSSYSIFLQERCRWSFCQLNNANELVILWLRVNIPFTQYISGSTPLLILFRLSLCPMLIYLSSSLYHPNIYIVVCLGSDLTQAICPTTLPSRFISSPHVPTLHPTLSNLELSHYTPFESSDWHF